MNKSILQTLQLDPTQKNLIRGKKAEDFNWCSILSYVKQVEKDAKDGKVNQQDSFRCRQIYDNLQFN